MQRSGFGPGSPAWFFFFFGGGELGFLLLVWQRKGWRWADRINCRRSFDLQKHTNNKTTQLHSWFLPLTYPMCSPAFVYEYRICTSKFLLHISILYFWRGFSILSHFSSQSFFLQQSVLGKSNVLTSLETENIPPAKSNSSKPSSNTRPIQEVSGWQNSLHFSRCKLPQPCQQPPLPTYTNCPIDPPGTTARPWNWFHAIHYTDMFWYLRCFQPISSLKAVFVGKRIESYKLTINQLKKIKRKRKKPTKQNKIETHLTRPS